MMEQERKKFEPDEGYYFGLGVFETIAVEENRPLFLREHLERLTGGIKTLGLTPPLPEGEIKEKQVYDWLAVHPVSHGGLKITVSQKNVFLEGRENTYTKEQYEQGFTADFAETRRNSTSVFTYLKSLNYGDCILEKRAARQRGIDEPVFLNERMEICEGAVSNIFFVEKDNRVVTPKLSCGLLPGTIRRVLLEHGMAEEKIICPGDIYDYKEAFITNSLMGIMPLKSLGDCFYREWPATIRVRKWLEELIKCNKEEG